MSTGRTLATIVLASACGAFAQEPATPAPTSSPAPPLDVVFVLDNSGSMRQNDPSFLMRMAVTGFAQGVAPDARLSLISFDEQVHVLLGLTPASDPDFQARLAEASLGLDYRGRRTDIPAGVERGLYTLREQGRADAVRVMVLVTDGIVDVGSPAADLERARWLRETLTAEARESSVRIYGIAFTDQADYLLLQSLAHETSGDYFRAASADELKVSLERLRARLLEPLPERATPTPATARESTSAQADRLLRDWRMWVGIAVVLVLLFLIATMGLAFVVRARRRAASAGAPAGAMPQAMLRDLGGYSQSETHPLDQAAFLIGRIAGVNDLVLPYDSVTKQHALIEFREGCFRLRDLRSTNGTYVNGERLGDAEWVLKHGDVVAFHRCEFEFIIDELWEESPTTFMERPAG